MIRGHDTASSSARRDLPHDVVPCAHHPAVQHPAAAQPQREIVLERPRGGVGAEQGSDDDAPEAGERRVTVRGVGARWAGLDVAALNR